MQGSGRGCHRGFGDVGATGAWGGGRGEDPLEGSGPGVCVLAVVAGCGLREAPEGEGGALSPWEKDRGTQGRGWMWKRAPGSGAHG